MSHKSWTARDGAPQGVTALAQAPDGVLWVGSESGLFSFDGRTFTPFQARPGEPELPAGPVESVLVARNGDLWVGFRTVGIARVRHGGVTHFAHAGPQPLRLVQHIRQSSDGAIWALNRQQTIIRFGGDGSWHEETTPLGVPGDFIYDIFIDASNSLWVDQGGHLYRRPLNQSKYFVTETQADWVFGYAEAPDHSLWVADTITNAPGGPKGRIQHIDPSGKVLARLPEFGNAEDILYEPDGSLVLTPFGGGLVRIPAEALAGLAQAVAPLPGDRFGLKDGLSSNAALSLLMDNDGNLWVGGKRGLDRFRTARLAAFVQENGMTEPQLCAGKSGDVWITGATTGDDLLYKVSGGTRELVRHDGQIISLSCGPDGNTWLAATTGFGSVHAGQYTALPPIPGADAFSQRQVVAAADGVVYASIVGNPNATGIWRYAQARWTRLTSPDHLPSAPYTIYLDSHGRLWAGYQEGQVALPLEGGRILASDKPGVANIYAILETTHGVFAGGLNGLAILRNNRVEMLPFADRLSSLGIGGIVESGNGDLWLNASHGIVHLRSEDLEATLRDPRRPVKSEVLTEGDFAGPATLWPGKVSAARDADGHLWFATLNDVFHMDPTHLTTGIHPPILSIRSMSADQRPITDDGTIAPGPQTLDIQYLGVNLTTPESVVYQYRLDGLDTAWQDAGHRTEAIYAHLRPGTYTFRVMASNGDGVWTAPASSAAFTVLPHFYQTAWFLLLCVLAVLLLLWFAVTVRLQVISREIRGRAEERADERIRISRDLHDTLLQGVQGLLLTVHVAAQKVSPEDESRKLLERALLTADQVIVEGRNRVSDLRSDRLTDEELLGALENIGRDLAHEKQIAFHVWREGGSAALYPHVADEVFSMARESITNAFRHSGALEINVKLSYGSRHFILLCRDNGEGFTPKDAEKPGHWGLKGMRERALKLGGELRLQSQPGCGTEIVLTIPVSRAYINYSRLAFFLRWPGRPRLSPAARC